MKIHSVQIKNFRSFMDETIFFDDYTCFVGPNGAGKSTVLYALNVFFRETENVSTNLNILTAEDFHLKNTENPIEIIVTFSDLNEEAQSDFSDYCRQEKLTVSSIAVFDPNTEKAEVKQYGQRLGMEEFKPFFKAVGDGEKVSDLKSLYLEIKKNIPSIPAPGTKDAMIGALHNYENEHPENCKLIPSEDQFYGVSKGANRLAKYIQWVYVPAVKDATTEQMEAKNTALGKLLARTVRAKTNFSESIKTLRQQAQNQYQELLDTNQGILDDISLSLSKRIIEWAHPDAKLRLQWKQDPDKSIRVEEPWAWIIAGEGDFEGELARFGHGLQRSYLLALLQELAGESDTEGPRLILGCEEPELYQHPPQARHLADVLEKLSHKNSQVMISTHSPIFVSGERFENVRMVRMDQSKKSSGVIHVSYDELTEAINKVTDETPIKPEGLLAKVHQSLQPSLNEMFFTDRLILVEGLEDIAYITTYLVLLDKWEEYRKARCHIVPANGKSEILRPLVIASKMKIPVFVIFDSDTDKLEKLDKSGHRAKHEKDNKAILQFMGYGSDDPFPKETLWKDNLVLWNSDIGKIVEEEIGKDEWQKFRSKADCQYGQIGDLKKNTLHIGASLTYAWEAEKKSPSLEKLCDKILVFGSISK